jgi:hypothetical protein
MRWRRKRHNFFHYCAPGVWRMWEEDCWSARHAIYAIATVFKKEDVGCFQSSEGFSQAIRDGTSPPDSAPIRRHPQQPIDLRNLKDLKMSL